MNRWLLFLGAWTISTCSFAQTNVDDLTTALIDQNRSSELLELDAIRSINYYLKLAEALDTIAFKGSGDTISYSYKNKEIDPFFDRKKPNKPVSITVGIGHGRRSYRGVFKKPGGEERRVRIIKDHLYDREKNLIVAHYRDDVLCGRYVEFAPSNAIIKEGSYYQIDSLYQDTIISINPDTYEVVYSTIQRTKYPIKTGSWAYRNPEGDTLRVEHYPKHP